MRWIRSGRGQLVVTILGVAAAIVGDGLLGGWDSVSWVPPTVVVVVSSVAWFAWHRKLTRWRRATEAENSRSR